jgi:chromosome segregation ATPase
MRKQLAAKDREAKKLRLDVADAERRIKDMRKNWMQVYDDILKEHEQELQRCKREAVALQERALRAKRRLDNALDTITAMTDELSRANSKLECERGKNLKLMA